MAQNVGQRAAVERAQRVRAKRPVMPVLAPRPWSAAWRSSLAHIIGVKVSDTTADTTTATDSVTANSETCGRPRRS